MSLETSGQLSNSPIFRCRLSLAWKPDGVVHFPLFQGALFSIRDSRLRASARLRLSGGGAPWYGIASRCLRAFFSMRSREASGSLKKIIRQRG